MKLPIHSASMECLFSLPPVFVPLPPPPNSGWDSGLSLVGKRCVVL